MAQRKVIVKDKERKKKLTSFIIEMKN